MKKRIIWKHCRICHKDRSIGDFNNNQFTKDGLCNLCRYCHKNLYKHKSKKQIAKEYLQEWDKKNPGYRRKYIDKWQKEHPNYGKDYYLKHKKV